MHCPKCGQNYPDGFQRFCDSDGCRLVPDASETGTGVNVFASILNKPVPRSGGGVMPDLPHYLAADDRRNGDSERRRDEQMRALFDQKPEDELSGDIFVIEDEPSPKVYGRRVDSKQSAPEHVDLIERGLLQISLNQFDIKAPQNFVGKTVKGRYRVTEMIAEDDMGVAYFADDRVFGDKSVVVRILTSDGGEDAITRSIYAEERISLSHLNHPNVARLFDSGSFANGTTFLINEHIDGLTVDDILLIHGQFTPLRAAQIIKQLAYAISDVHNEGILHRDIRPANISVTPLETKTETETESVKILNFGVANGLPNSANIAYQAPEILDGRIPTVATDNYSLAVVAYEMLTGKTPYQGDSAKEFLGDQRNGLKSWPTTFQRELVTRLERIFERALAVDPRLRYPSARDFGDAFYEAVLFNNLAMAETQPEVATDVEFVNKVPRPSNEKLFPVSLPDAVEDERVEKSVAEGVAIMPAVEDEPKWSRSSPDPIGEPDHRLFRIVGIALLALLAAGALGWYYLFNKPVDADYPVAINVDQNRNVGEPPTSVSAIAPPPERHVPQPANTDYFQSSKQNLKGDLIRNFVGFKLYYPKDWKLNGSQESNSPNTRGKFLDISKSTPEGRLKEQMLISYYPSKGTITDDAEKFPQMVKETNETLKKLLPGYQVVSEGPTNVNGDWKAYEVKFQGSGTSDTGERLLVWGRRLFIPAARLGVRNGFEITMLATSYADNVHSVDDIGVRGELASILDTFEPSQNF